MPAVQSEADAFSEDIALTAEANGWTIEEALARYEAGEIVGEIAHQVAKARPDVLVGAALPEEPGAPAELYIKGPADDFVRGLVADAEIEIRIIDNQPYSSAELDEREQQLGAALQAMGFTNIGIGYDLRKAGRLDAAVTKEPGLPDAPAAIVARLPESLRDEVDLTVTEEPVGVNQTGDLPRLR